MNKLLENLGDLVSKQQKFKAIKEEHNVTVDHPDKCEEIQYPAEGDVGQVNDDQGQAIACEVTLETELSCDTTGKVVNVGILGYGDQDVLKEPGEAEQEDQEGPVNHILPQGVPEPNLVSTALRIMARKNLEAAPRIIFSGTIGFRQLLKICNLTDRS